MAENPIDKKFLSELSELKTIGRYKIERKLGQGASGVVYLGFDPFIKRHVAIKISRPTSNQARDQFFVEAQSAGRLNNPGMVAIFDVGAHNGFCYLTMEYVEGTTLEKQCEKKHLLPVNKAVEVIFSVCKAIDYVHRQGIIHRDIKPSNIMLNRENRPKLTDFGIAQMTGQTSEMGVWGTPSYMAPEQLKDESIGSYSDVFSLGCVLYELLTGEKAFPGKNNFAIMYKITNEEPESIIKLRPELPPIFDDIIKKTISKDYEKRYQTCMDLAFDLQVALRGLSDKTHGSDIKSAVEYVRHVPFFHNFSKEQVQELGTTSSIIKFPKKMVIVAEGEIDDTFFIILSGKAKIQKSETDIATIGQGECFGEMAYICGQARTATVVADTDCILMKISATLMDKSSESIQLLFFKNFAMTLVKRLSNRQLPSEKALPEHPAVGL